MIEQLQSARQTEPQFLPAPFLGPKRILLATDFSPASEMALEYALSLARSYSARVVLAHVIPVDLMMLPELTADAHRKLRAAADEGWKKTLRTGRFFGVPYEVITKEGAIWPTLQKLIDYYGIDLVVVGTHGAGAIQKILIGSTAEEIFRQSSVPVLTVGPSVVQEPLYGVELKNILFATDFALSQENHAVYAFSLAQQQRSRLTLLHVISRNGWEDAEGGREAAMHKLRQLVPRDAEMHCLPLFRAPIGRPVEEILRVAGEISADLIVLGAKNRKGLAGHRPHTTAYQVVRGAPCPVLTLRS